MIYYCIGHSTAVPRLIRNKPLLINLTEMDEKTNKMFSYESRICILKESRRIIANRCRNDSELSAKSTIARAYRSQGHSHTKS